MNHHDRTSQKEEELLGIIVILSTLTVWIGTGWLTWHWLNVDSFGSGILFVIIWGIVGGFAQAIIAPLISVFLMSIFSLFTK